MTQDDVIDKVAKAQGVFSEGGATQDRWRKETKEIYYRNVTGRRQSAPASSKLTKVRFARTPKLSRETFLKEVVYSNFCTSI